jgi:recombination protein RecT
METNPAKTNVQPAVVEREITNDVLTRVNAFRKNGELTIPKDYSPENALKSAYLILSDLKDKNQKPILEVCSKKSIANSLLKMVVEGLSPMKKQCYFIPYGTELTLIRSYQGAVALAKRVSNLIDVVPNVIYQDDVFEFGIDLETGRRKVLKHEQKLSNIDNKKIVGAYCYLLKSDGKNDIEVMTIDEIRNSWNQGYTKGKSAVHENFTQEMAKKTVINRACKNIINSSTDALLIGEDEEKTEIETTEQAFEDVRHEIVQEEMKEISFDAAPEKQEVVKDATLFPEKAPF